MQHTIAPISKSGMLIKFDSSKGYSIFVKFSKNFRDASPVGGAYTINGFNCGLDHAATLLDFGSDVFSYSDTTNAKRYGDIFKLGSKSFHVLSPLCRNENNLISKLIILFSFL